MSYKLHSQSTYAHKNPEHIKTFSIIQSVFYRTDTQPIMLAGHFLSCDFYSVGFFSQVRDLSALFFIIALAKCGAMKGKKRTPNFLSKNSSFSSLKGLL